MHSYPRTLQSAHTGIRREKEELEHYETMMGVPRGRLAVTMDTITDAMGARSASTVFIARASVTRQARSWTSRSSEEVWTDAKELIQSVMEELKKAG